MTNILERKDIAYLNDLKHTQEYNKFSLGGDTGPSGDLIGHHEIFDAYVLKKKLFELENNSLVFMKHPYNIETLIHAHDFIEIEYVVNGQIPQYINGEKVILKHGSLAIFNKNVVHSIDRATSSDLMYHIFINEKLFDLKFFGLTPDDNVFSSFIYRSLYLDKQYNDYLIVEDLSVEITNIVNCILNEARLKRKHHEHILYSLMTIFFSMLSREKLKESFFSYYKDTQKTKMLIQMLKYVQNNYRDATLQSTADAFHLHPNYFCKLVKELTGKNFSELLFQTKMQMAGHKLTTTAEKVESIAQEVGYSNANHFHKQFKLCYGVTPKQYRDNYLRELNGCDKVIVKGRP